MGRSEQAGNKIGAGWSFTSTLDAPDRRTATPPFLFCLASVLLLGTTSAPITEAILQNWQGLCQEGTQKNAEVRK